MTKKMPMIHCARNFQLGSNKNQRKKRMDLEKMEMEKPQRTRLLGSADGPMAVSAWREWPLRGPVFS